MALTFRENTGDFEGVHRKLTVAEADDNIHTLHLRIEDLEGAAGKTIEDIEWTGTALIIHYTDSTTDGPFPLPVATMRSAGLWTNDTPYAYLDVVSVAASSAVSGAAGIYMALINHVSPVAPELFDPEAVDDSDNLLWLPLFPAGSFVPMVSDEVTGETHTLTLTDANKYLRFTNTLGCEITVPHNDTVPFPLDTEISVRQAASGNVTITPFDEEVVINPPHPQQVTVTPWMGSTITLKKIGENEWDYIGVGAEASA